MTEALKSMNKKYLVIIASIFVVFFMIILIVAISRSCSKPGSNYESVENKLVDAAKKYYKNNPDAKPKEGESATLTAATLVEGKYMKALSSYLKDTTCVADVKVYNNGGQYLVIPNLECSEYKTTHLKDKIIKDNLVTSSANTTVTDSTTDVGLNTETNTTPTVTEDTSKDYISGLYNDNGVYVFKGKKPNNYLSFGGSLWRIIDINENGIIRVVKSDADKRSTRWDTKYNAEKQSAIGINDYKNSDILERITTDYKDFKDENKTHIAPMDVCVGKRNDSLLGTSRDIDCSSKLENQYIALVNSGDFARASLDENCTTITRGSCINYNYLSLVLVQTWTTNAHADNSYQALAVNSGIVKAFNAKDTVKYHWVLGFRGDELYIKGNGTEEDPYVVGNTSKK